MINMKNSNILKMRHTRLLSVLFFIMAFNNGLAIYHGDTTLAWWIFRSVVIGVGYLCTLLCALGTIFSPRKNNMGYTTEDFIAIIIPVIYFLVILISDSDGNFSFFFLLLVRMSGLALFLIADKECKIQTFQLYKKCIVIMAAIGICIYLVHIVSIPLPHRVVPYYSVVGAGNYYDYFVSYVYVSRSGFTRLCGLFNEPGYFGTILAFILCTDGINLKKAENIIMVIAGCFTFSFAFFALLIVYLILSSYKKPKLMVFLIVLLLVMVYIVPNVQFSNHNVARLVSRFYSLDTSLQSRTRPTFDALFSRWEDSNNLLFGYGHGYCKAIDPDGSSSYKSYFVDYGIVGFVMLFLPLFIYSFGKSKRNLKAVFYTIIFFVSIYQRPNVFTILYFVVLYGGIESICAEQTWRKHYET